MSDSPIVIAPIQPSSSLQGSIQLDQHKLPNQRQYINVDNVALSSLSGSQICSE